MKPCHKSSPGTPFSGFTLIELLMVVAIISLLAAILFPVFSRAREDGRRSVCQSNLKQIGMGILQYEQDFDEHFPPINTGQGFSSGAVPYLFWPYFAQSYIKNTQVFNCPDFRYTETIGQAPAASNNWVGGSSGSYGINIATSQGTYTSYKGRSLAILQSPAELGLFFEASQAFVANGCQGYWNSTSGYSNLPSGAPTIWWTAGTTDAPGLTGTYDYGTPDSRHFGGLNVGFADGHVKWMQYLATITPPAGVTNANWRLWHPNAA